MKKTILAAMTALFMLAAAAVNAAEVVIHQEIYANGSNASVPINNDFFTGVARMEPLFHDNEISSAYVTFNPGVRTNWHYHPKGQLLIVTYGSGLTQELGQPIKEIKAGDVIWCPPGVTHWHGGGYQTAMTHLAVTKFADGKTVTWLNKVTDAEYNGR